MPKTPDELRSEAARLLLQADQLDRSRQVEDDTPAAMTPDQINKARLAGQLDELLGKASA